MAEDMPGVIDIPKQPEDSTLEVPDKMKVEMEIGGEELEVVVGSNNEVQVQGKEQQNRKESISL